MSTVTVPAGFVLVPEKPTKEMIRQGEYAYLEIPEHGDGSLMEEVIYGAMIAARPAPAGDDVREARRQRVVDLMAPLMSMSEDEIILLRHSLPPETLARLRAALSREEGR